MYKSNNIYSSICWEYPLQTRKSARRKSKKQSRRNSYVNQSKKSSIGSVYAYYGAIILFFAGLLFFITISISKAAIAEPQAASNKFELPYDIDSSNLLLEDLATLYKEEKKDNTTKEALDKITRPFSFTKKRVLNNESLKKLAAKYGLKADTIILINNLKRPSDIKTGDIVIIPNQDGRLINVKANDSIYKIAERYGVSWKKIVDCNNLSDINIKSGMKLFIPDSGMTKYEREKFYQTKSKQAARVNSAKINNSKGKNITTSGIFSWPLKGAITSSYGLRSDPITGVKDFHTGLDIRGAMNTPVKAPNDGVVAYTGWSNVYGNFILLKHDNNIVTMYGHLNKINVKREECVKKGMVLGLVGSTGRSTGPHLHFEILKNNKRDNPLKYLSAEK